MIYKLQHTDTCLPCYVQDHCNGENERLLGVYVDGLTTYGEVRNALHDEMKGRDMPRGFDWEAAAIAIDEAFSTVDLDDIFDPALDLPDEESDEYRESCYAWFRLSWESPE